MSKPIYYFLLCIFIIVGCSSPKKGVYKKAKSLLYSDFYDNQFTGFMVFDTENEDVLLNFNGERYFTPASNVKIFTLFASLELLKDSIPTLKYKVSNDTIYVQGTGDPTFLHPYFQDSTALEFMNDHKNISVHLNNFFDSKYGPGWSWEDYHYYYQVEKNSLPMYGNVATIQNSDQIEVTPLYFKDSVFSKPSKKNRKQYVNSFFYSRSRKDTLEVPILTSKELTKKLLNQALGKEIELVNHMPGGHKKTLYSLPVDSVYRRMMLESDNFLAEQLLVLASSTLSDSLDGRRTITYLLENQLSDLKQPPRWVDGSGLSRYNLFSPESMVHVLHEMYTTIPRERLFGFFPEGGVSGTLKNWYSGNPEPYIFAKTGSLGNNHNLSGYLVTKSGKTLIFSFMNNHFRHSSSAVKENMQALLEHIRDTY